MDAKIEGVILTPELEARSNFNTIEFHYAYFM